MHPLWTGHIKDKDEAEDFKKYIRNSSPILDRLSEIIEEKMKAARKEAHDKEGYESPAWAFKQADLIGFERGLIEVQKLLSLER